MTKKTIYEILQSSKIIDVPIAIIKRVSEIAGKYSYHICEIIIEQFGINMPAINGAFSGFTVGITPTKIVTEASSKISNNEPIIIHNIISPFKIGIMLGLITSISAKFITKNIDQNLFIKNITESNDNNCISMATNFINSVKQKNSNSFISKQAISPDFLCSAAGKQALQKAIDNNNLIEDPVGEAIGKITGLINSYLAITIPFLINTIPIDIKILYAAYLGLVAYDNNESITHDLITGDVGNFFNHDM